MKLSQIANKKGLTSATIDIFNNYAVVQSFIRGKKKGVLSVHGKMDIDIKLKEQDLRTVEHLGIKRYRDYTTPDFYLNVYNYNK